MRGSNAQILQLLVVLDECFKMDDSRFYFKDNLLKQAGIKREDLPYNCVDRNYNIFES